MASKLFSSFLLVGACVAAFGQTPAADYNGGGANFGAWPGATGFWFQVNTPIAVTGLGYYDFTGGGLPSAADVGIFFANGTPVVTGTVDGGAADPLIPGTVGGTRVIGVTPTLLTPGSTYYCVADNVYQDGYTFGTVTFAPQINWLSYGDIDTNSIFAGPPDMPGGTTGNLDGTFVFNAVPEPAPIVCLGVGALALIRRRRK